MQERFEGLKDPHKKEKAYKKLTSGEVSSFLANAPVIIIVCAKLDVWDVPYDSAMATQNMVLMAHALGLGSCVVVAPVSDMRDDIKVMKLLKIPHGYKVIAPLAVGYPDESPNPRPRLPLKEIIFYEEFERRRVK
jgi:nitroreductase